jgi:hypothetical protein
VIHDVPTNDWDLELEELFLQTGARFCRVEARRRMRDYVRGLLGPVGRKNSWQLAEYAGHATPHGLRHLLSHSRWDADGLRDDLQGLRGRTTRPVQWRVDPGRHRLREERHHLRRGAAPIFRHSRGPYFNECSAEGYWWESEI